jgi:hypothetical protein
MAICTSLCLRSVMSRAIFDAPMILPSAVLTGEMVSEISNAMQSAEKFIMSAQPPYAAAVAAVKENGVLSGKRIERSEAPYRARRSKRARSCAFFKSLLSLQEETVAVDYRMPEVADFLARGHFRLGHAGVQVLRR